MTVFHDDMTLAEARDALRLLVDHGHRCPCCTQFAKVYKRKLNTTNAYLLIEAYRAVGTAPFHAPTYLTSHAGGEWARLTYWDLIAESDAKRDDGGRAGWWRVTERGASFARCEITVPKYVRLYDGRRLGFAGEEVTIRQALGLRFNYDELMAGV